MATHELLIAPHRFAVGYHRQTFWNWLIGIAFFLGGVGGGLFFVSILTGHVAGMIVAYVLLAGGKNTAHLLFLGRPERFLSAARRPDRSWIARGIWAMGIFMATGIVSILLQAHSKWIHLSEPFANLVFALAAASAFFIACYDGFLMRSSAGVAFWRSLLLPLLLFMYASLGGVTLSLTIRELRGEAFSPILPSLERWLLVANFFLLAVYLYRMTHSFPAARESLREWLSGTYSRVFWGLVLFVGVVSTLLLSLAHSTVESSVLVVLIACCELIGDFSMMMLMLKSGLFAQQVAAAFDSAKSSA